MTNRQPCCEGGGMITLNIRVSASDVVKAFVGFESNPAEVDLISNSAGVYSYTKTGIGQGQNRVFLTINGCKYTFEESFRLGSGRELNYVSYDIKRELCEFEQICGLDTIPNAPYYTKPTIDWENVEANWLGKCRADVFCGDIKMDEPIKMDKKSVSKAVYRILYAQAEAAQVPYLYPRNNIDDRFIDNTNLCHIIEYCPLSMEPFNRIPVAGNASGTYIQEDGCIYSSCGIFSRVICPEDGFLPPKVEFD